LHCFVGSCKGEQHNAINDVAVEKWRQHEVSACETAAHHIDQQLSETSEKPQHEKTGSVNAEHDQNEESSPADQQTLCSGQLMLENLLSSWSSTSGGHIFFLETSDKETLTAREACALESAAR
jgi:hypothetical protein